MPTWYRYVATMHKPMLADITDYSSCKELCINETSVAIEIKMNTNM
jgi:hypothetical protein